MNVNIVEIKSGDCVIINDTRYDHIPTNAAKNKLELMMQASSIDKITWIYGDHDVTILRKTY